MDESSVQSVLRALDTGSRLHRDVLSSDPLRTALDLCVELDRPVAILWGDDLELLYNEPFQVLLGDERRALLGRRASELADSTGAQAARALIAQLVPRAREVVARNARVSCDASHVTGGGAAVCYSFSLAPIRDVGPNGARRVGGVFVLGPSVATPCDDAGAARAQILADREDLLSVVAHDLKNPLNVISLSAYQLSSFPAPEELKPRLDKQAEAIKRSAKRINDLVGDVLDLTRLEFGELALEADGVPAERIVADALEGLRPQVQTRSITVQMGIEAGLAVACDRERTTRVLAGLVHNAVTFSPPQSTIRVSARAEPDRALFEVRDVGPGIPEERRSRLFDRTVLELRGGKKRLARGLPLAKRIIEAQRGRLWLESETGLGTVVRFTLPLAEPEAES